MSIIVKGMEIPESCGRCDFNVSSLYCNRTGSEIDRDYEYSERLSDCPIFELPEKHGDLIDRDTLKEASYEAKNNGFGYAQVVDVWDIDRASTIFEAEDGT